MSLSAPEPTGARTRGRTSDVVVDHLLDLLFTGELRAGDRIDLNAVAADLGVSRAPVREALVLLERDGLVAIPYHKGAFVAHFDAAALREAFHLYGMLSALGSSRLAGSRPAEPLARLSDALAAAAAAADAGDTAGWERSAREFRRIVNQATAGPRLRSLLRSFAGLVPAASRTAGTATIAAERDLLVREYAAICDGDPGGAADAALEHLALIGDTTVAILTERGVLPAGQGRRGPTALPDTAVHLLATASTLDRNAPHTDARRTGDDGTP